MTDIKIVKQLRDETGVSFSIISKALADAEGNIDKARAILKEKGAEVAAKKQDVIPIKVASFHIFITTKRLVLWQPFYVKQILLQ